MWSLTRTGDLVFIAGNSMVNTDTGKVEAAEVPYQKVNINFGYFLNDEGDVICLLRNGEHFSLTKRELVKTSELSFTGPPKFEPVIAHNPHNDGLYLSPEHDVFVVKNGLELNASQHKLEQKEELIELKVLGYVDKGLYRVYKSNTVSPGDILYVQGGVINLTQRNCVPLDYQTLVYEVVFCGE